ncbi:hypothetical protein [Thiofaba sp. EF100]|uniref:hypothetical protein n=1 Tax=Thiofaba sp. EF100 TaxID=3121274 RepID=UPI003221F9A8
MDDPTQAMDRSLHCTARLLLALGLMGAPMQPVFAQSPDQPALTQTLLEQAASLPRGSFPRAFHGEQAYWTVIGAPDSPHAALLSEDGLLEPWPGGPSIEPFLHLDGRRIGWADVRTTQQLLEGDLPLPSVTWRIDEMRLDIDAVAGEVGGCPLLLARYRLRNLGTEPHAATLELALRPLQVYPPWLRLAVNGGAAPIHRLVHTEDALLINDERRILALTPPGGFSPDAGPGVAGAWRWPLVLAPGEVRETILAFPFEGAPAPAALRAAPAALFERLRLEQRMLWREQTGRVMLHLPTAEGEDLAAALRTSLAYLLIHSPRPLIRPGSRGYARAWIRDGALMAHALLQLGHAERARDFVRWYTGFQQEEGGIPCCIDALGPDPTVEHDSHGEFIFLLAETVRHTEDLALARALWPAAQRAAGHLLALRAERLGPAFEAPERRRFRGLLPDSASHEGYLQNPVHSYWDDFFALRGLKDAAWLAERLGDDAAAERYRRAHAAMREDVVASIRQTMQDKGLTTLPASADLGDFDPTSTAIVLSPTQEDGLLPQEALRLTFDAYLAMVRERAAGSPRWPGYTPYEWRNVEALARIGRREEAWTLLRLLLADRRPRGWNAWPEVVWADPRRPDYIGDMPHGWVAGEFIRAVLSLIAHVREADQALVIGAGLPAAWLDAPEGLRVHELSTPFGRLDLDIDHPEAGTLRLRLGGTLRTPAGGVVLELPALADRVFSVDGQPFRPAGPAIKLSAVPAVVLIRHAPPSPSVPRSP